MYKMSSAEFTESTASILCTSMSMVTSTDASGNLVYNGIAATTIL